MPGRGIIVDEYYRCSLALLCKNHELLEILRISNHLYSQNTFEAIIKIKELLIKKHQEQEAYLDAELED